jgi:hypothetical protein
MGVAEIGAAVRVDRHVDAYWDVFDYRSEILVMIVVRARRVVLRSNDTHAIRRRQEDGVKGNAKRGSSTLSSL